MSKSEPKSKSSAKTNAIKVLKFPTIELNRLSQIPKFNLGMLAEYNQLSKVEIDTRHLSLFEIMLANPDEYLFKLYQDSYSPNELPLLQESYSSFDDNQKRLAYLFVRPSFLLSDNYLKAIQGEYLLKEDDFSPIVFSIYGSRFYINHTYITGYDWFEIAIKSLPLSLKKAVLQGSFPFEKYGYPKATYGLTSILYLWANLWTQMCDNTLVTSFFERDFSLIKQDKTPYVREYLLEVLQGLDHPKTVNEMLNAFPTKTLKKHTIRYSQRYLQNMINEAIYLMFNKNLNDDEKKAKKNAKLFFDYLIENHKTELIATLQAYDQQLDKPILEPFLADYQAHQLALQHQDKTTVQHDIAQGTDPTGTPVVLTNDDWQKLTKKRTITLPADIHLAELPPLIIASTGQPLGLDTYTRLIKMLMLSEAGEPFALLLPTLAYLTPESQTALADKLWSRFYVPDSKNKWRILASGLLYHPTLDAKVWDYMKMQESDPTARAYLRHSFTTLAEQAIIRHQLAKDGIDTEQNRNLGNQALRMLIKLSQKARTTLRPVAEKELKRYADSMGLTADDLADRVLPTLGLDAQGKRVFDFGNRQFTMRLNAELEPEFVDNTGKKLKKLPTPNANDNEQQATQAVNDFKAMKKALTAFKREDVPRLELIMVNQRRIAFADFEQFFIKNPLMLRITYQLIWGVYDKENKDKLLTPFRVVETGEVLDMDDNDLTIADDSLIGLVHPIDLSDEQIAKFGQSLQDDNIIQPIMQLARPTYRLTDEEKTQGKITRFDKETFATGSLIGLKNKGWIDGMGSGGVCEYYDQTIANADWHFNFTGYQMWGGVPSDDKGQQIGTISVPSGANAVSISEFLYVMDSMARLVG